MIYTTWDEYYKSRVRNNEYRAAFRLKYGLFLKEIIFNIKRLAQELGTPVILKEEGCGIGTVSLSISSMEEKLLGSMGLTSVSETKEVSKVIFSDISPVMLGLCHENTCPPSIVVTHGVLEHFADDDIMKIISTYDNDNVLFQAHCVPTNRYKSPSFGDERLLAPEVWDALIKPDYYILDNNGCDLYMFKLKKS